MKRIKLTQDLWEQTWIGLQKRGGGVRESACVWGGTRSATEDHALSVTFLDDLPGVHAGARYHQLSRKTVEALFKILTANRQMIVADIHTHPGYWVDLSPTDAEHPIEFRRGLPAMILPYFAMTSPTMDGLGLHEYVGDGEWHRLNPTEVQAVLKIGP